MRCVNKHHIRMLRFTYLKTNNFAGICASIGILGNLCNSFFIWIYVMGKNEKGLRRENKIASKTPFYLSDIM